VERACARFTDLAVPDTFELSGVVIDALAD
jgi:hypothetical protein